MIQKIKSKKGFTLAELLIVIAIIGVLAAIAIPVFSAQLTKANEAVDAANLRAATSMAVVDYQMNHTDGNGGEVSYKAYVNTVGKTSNIAVGSGNTVPTGFTTELTAKVGTGKIAITISDGGKVTKSDWTGA